MTSSWVVEVNRSTAAASGASLIMAGDDELVEISAPGGSKPQWRNEYRQHRPMVERAIAWLTRNNRKLRYCGVARDDRWLHHRIAALNLRRLIALGLIHTGTIWAIA